MYQNINWHNFQGAFYQMGRSNQFSYEALRALFDYLEQLEEEIGEKIELDVIALCCEYREIEEDDHDYKEYVGEDAERDDMIITTLPTSILVRED